MKSLIYSVSTFKETHELNKFLIWCTKNKKRWTSHIDVCEYNSKWLISNEALSVIPNKLGHPGTQPETWKFLCSEILTPGSFAVLLYWLWTYFLCCGLRYSIDGVALSYSRSRNEYWAVARQLFVSFIDIYNDRKSLGTLLKPSADEGWIQIKLNLC